VDNEEVPAIGQYKTIDRLADAFEKAFRAGQPLEIDRLVADYPDLQPHLLRELITLEIELRRSGGEQVNLDEYRHRFPHEATVVDVFAMAISHFNADLKHGERVNDMMDEYSVPERIGRYVIQKLLGQGGFGVVYLANDSQLDRLVALKVPRRECFTTSDQIASFIHEARSAAKLKHPGLVTVYDVQKEEHLPYIVQEYIDGENLAVWASKQHPSFKQIVKVLTVIVEALGYAHQQGITHCDLKLANVLMDRQSQPHVADFGLAVHDSARLAQKGARFGTPYMMAPEQVRGEGHRLDGRTDLWALGVMLYELLVNQRPFNGRTLDELFCEIETLDPRPPRQINPQVPRELERICLSCLQKRRTDRYNAANDLLEDLLAWLTQVDTTEIVQSSKTVADESATPINGSSSSERAAPIIIPKGLRSFDVEDAGFFLDLLPGPRDRNGLPDSIRFWKNRIEETDPDKTFAVGLIYGPSGCGKSSLLKAGILPRLSERVLSINVEATAGDTEVRILRQLQKQLPHLSTELSLPEACAELRKTGAGRLRKVLIVIDQFEQWLHANSELKQTKLVDALRQCDGGQLQAILLVRDDFFASVHRLFQELEYPLIEGSNYALVDRFDKQHSRKVLTAFGRAYGKLDDKLSAIQEQFVLQSIDQLADGEKVISVRLALFAEMMKSRPWTPASLEEIGGASGVGVTFLDETFTAKSAPPSHRVHEQAIRQVLQALLPESGTGIKGAMQSQAELMAACSYQNRNSDFKEVLQILDRELRLITPTDPDGEKFEFGSKEIDNETLDFVMQNSIYFQLTHDYLVPSLRDWLTRKQRETRKGRAELKLEELAATWSAKRENKQLPKVTDWIAIGLLTQSKRWTDKQRAMMRQAARVCGIRWGGMLAIVLLVAVGIQQWASAERWKNLKELTRVATDSLQNNLGPSVPVNMKALRKLPTELVLPELRTRFDSASNARHKLSLSFALAGYGELDAKYLASKIDDIGEADTRNYVTALKATPTIALVILETEASKCTEKSLWRRKAKLAIAALALGDTKLGLDVCTYEDRPDPEQRTLFIDEFPKWDIDLRVVLDAVKSSESPALRSAICLGVGQISAEKIIDADRELWKSLALKWFVEQNDTSTHSASGWLLRRWGLTAPAMVNGNKVISGRKWFVNTVGITMLQMDPGTVELPGIINTRGPRTVEISEPYWVSDREVTRGQFEQFINDTAYLATEKPADWQGVDAFISPTADHPAQRLNWYDAVLYCNWLSLREGLKPCYERTGTKEKAYDNKEYDVWRKISGAGGYRLLDEAEWMYACRAGTSTEFSSGDDETLLAAYCQKYPAKLSALAGEKLPNAWGLFDFHGNVIEWCWDLFESPLSREKWQYSLRVTRGGAWMTTAESCRPGYSLTPNAPEQRNSLFGFRLALNSPSIKSPPADQVKD
jgi:serine/threonine protein kinase/formylglycine-generating enzyme required for sulfatase activity